VHPYSYYWSSPDVDNANDDYNTESLNMLMAYQEGQDDLFGGHDER
jgi:hypothetical protein